MTEGFCAVTVVGPARRADLWLPAEVPVAELLPELVDRLVARPAEAEARRWALLRLGGERLDEERGLAEQGVLEGAMLFLRELAEPPPPPVVEDLPESVAIAVEVRPGRWTPEVGRRLLLGTSAVWAAGASAAVLVDPNRLLWAAIAVAALTAAAVLARSRGQPLVAAVLALAAVPSWAVGGAALAASAGLHLPLAGAAAGALAGLVAAWRVSPAATAPAWAGMLLLAPAIVAAVLLGLPAGPRATPTAAAAVLSVLWLAAGDQAPRLAALLSGLPDAAVDTAASVAWVRERVDRAHRLLAWMLAAAWLGVAAAVTVLAADPSPFARALCAALAAAAGLRARRYRFTAEALPPALVGLLGASLLTGTLTGHVPGHGFPSPGVITAIALAWAGLALGLPRLDLESPRWRTYLGRLELAVDLVLVPLAVAVLGLFQLAADLGRRLS